MKRIELALWTFLFLVFLSVSQIWAGEPVQLRILYLNDFHGFAEPYKPTGNADFQGGIAFLAGEAKRLRQERPTLLLAAGDMIQGNPWANLFEGQSAMEVMNAMDVSAMVLGNHEFDFGQEVLKKRIQEAQFPILAANVQGVPGIKPYVIKELAGIRIAIIGLVTEHTPTATHPRNVKGLLFSSPVESARKVIQKLGQKPDLVIVISHLGLPADRRLAGAVKGAQVIVGGHTHTRLETPIKIKDTLIVQAWEHAKVLGVLDLTVQDGKVIQYESKLVPIRPDLMTPDPLVAKIVDHYKNQEAAVLDEVIGEAQVDLEAKGSRIRGTNLGNLVADILREDTKADVSLINGGGLRSDILRGPIRMKDLLSVLPFRNAPLVIKVTGRELKAILEHGLSDLSGTGGQFPQISGMRLRYKSASPAGERITQIWVKEKLLDPDSWYSLATNDFLAAGGDGYDVFVKILGAQTGYTAQNPRDVFKGTSVKNPRVDFKGYSAQNPRVVFFDSGMEIRHLVSDYIKEKKMISASEEERIKKVD